MLDEKCILGTCKIFADDLKLYLPLRDPAQSSFIGQRDIDLIVGTALSWGLELNVSKCSVLRCGTYPSNRDQPLYRIGGHVLPLVESSPDLGVTVDSTLKFHRHIDQLVGKAAGLALNILGSTCNREPLFMRELFITHIRPILDYASCLWNMGYMGDVRNLESVQRRWTKRVMGFERLPYSERLKELDLHSVKGRLLRADLIKVWKIFHGESAIRPDELFTLSPLLHTRGHQFKLSHERCRLELRRRFFSVRVVPLWNSLPDWVV